MPTSQPEQITKVIWLARALKPRTVLDVGFGFGKYGLLLREYLDIEEKRYDAAEWAIAIDGIEAHEPYIRDFHRQIYNRVLVGEALTIMRGFQDHQYDLILAVDILEHFDKETGRLFAAECRRVGKDTLISTPHGFTRQDAWLGNDYEVHRSVWCVPDFVELGVKYFIIDSLNLIGVF